MINDITTMIKKGITKQSILYLSFFGFILFSNILRAQPSENIPTSLQESFQKYETLKKNNPYQAVSMMKEAANLDIIQNNNKVKSSIYNRIGNIYLELKIYPLAMDAYFESLKYINLAKDENGKAYCLNDIGNVYYALNNFQLPQKYYQQSLEIFEKLKDNYGIAVACNNLGMVALKTQKYEKALSFYKRALVIRKQNNNLGLIGHSKLLIAQVFLEQGYFEKAINYMKEARQMYARDREPENVATADFQLGKAYFLYKKYPESLHFYESALNLYTLKQQHLEVGNTTLEIAACYENLDKYKQAEESAQRANILFESYKLKSRKLDAILFLSKLYLKQNRYKEAAKYQTEYINLEKLIETENSRSEFSKLLYSIDAFKETQEIKQLRVINSQQTLRTRLLLVLFLISILFIIYFIISFNQKRKQQQLMNNKTKEIASLELYKKEQENERLNRELNFRNNELASKAISMVKTNEFIDEIIKLLQQLIIPKTAQKSINQIIDKLNFFKKDDGWKEFEVRFEKVHSDFYRNIEKSHPNLTPNERKICAFLRLNMTTKEISALTYKSAKSIDVARSRLRKKMDLPRDENLITYLSQF
ncbi:tetratricopeptide repeat protein [Halosquirtibacter laminarini]|uniref:Tetratricopeptide repeat protein n=1 Tax=Halosquirtibacter laminarini TaxID=3374600 RepID=A0AC61NJ34_9BACT|nr:tetratricopeptide repeat protein [Prolixibacteraceae bacterium]